ncbi:MAG: ferredoxin [Lachnospiraceae bacterium]|nr:ferredoxin [Lachnospiraceae bacterium]
MKVKIDRDGCIACGQCTEICPDVFRIADDGFAEVYSEPTENNASMAKEAADNCPVQVIHYSE